MKRTATNTTPANVIIRRWKEWAAEDKGKTQGGLIAIFPDLPANPGMTLMYESVGQHGEGSYYKVKAQTLSTRPDEPDVLALLEELRGQGYRPVLRQHRSRRREQAGRTPLSPSATLAVEG